MFIKFDFFLRNVVKINGSLVDDTKEDSIWILCFGGISATYYIVKYLLIKPYKFAVNVAINRGIKAHATYKRELKLKEISEILGIGEDGLW